MTINHSLKIKIIADYLSGIKREDIAKKYGISTCSVSAIAEEFEEIPDIHKLRAMMIKLNETGNSPKTFYPSISLHKRIENLGLTMVQVENILEIFQEYAFRKKFNISELIDAIINAYSIAQRCGTNLERLGEHANAKVMVVERMETQARKLRNDIEYFPYKLNIDLTEFQEYQRNKPTLQKLVNMTTELDVKDRRIKLFEEDNKDLNLKSLEKDT
jgi:transcriptional regulator with XRE-family HTH domain